MSSNCWSLNEEFAIGSQRWAGTFVAEGYDDPYSEPDEDLPQLREQGRLGLWNLYAGPPEWYNGLVSPPSEDLLLDLLVLRYGTTRPPWEYDT